MIECTTNTDINEGFTLRLTAGNDIALPECPANVLETVPPSPKSHWQLRLTSENPLKPAHYDAVAQWKSPRDLPDLAQFYRSGGKQLQR